MVDINKTYENPYRLDYMVFIWGVLSGDSLVKCEPNLYTMNDIDLIYNEKTQTYSLSVETIYQFDTDAGKCDYLAFLLGAFDQWMQVNNFSTNETLSLNDVFHWQYNQFPSIPKAYAWFKFMVSAYIDYADKMMSHAKDAVKVF